MVSMYLNNLPMTIEVEVSADNFKKGLRDLLILKPQGLRTLSIRLVSIKDIDFKKVKSVKRHYLS